MKKVTFVQERPEFDFTDGLACANAAAVWSQRLALESFPTNHAAKPIVLRFPPGFISHSSLRRCRRATLERIGRSLD